jgi:hypothetical protein
MKRWSRRLKMGLTGENRYNPIEANEVIVAELEFLVTVNSAVVLSWITESIDIQVHAHDAAGNAIPEQNIEVGVDWA